MAIPRKIGKKMGRNPKRQNLGLNVKIARARNKAKQTAKGMAAAKRANRGK